MLSRFVDFLILFNQQTDDCVLWPYASSKGYGVFTAGGTQYAVHRVSCEMAYGEPPTPRHEAAHSCHTPACLNPRHLRWATRAENQADRIADGTSNQGSSHGMSLLTEFDVLAIRHYNKCGTKQRVLADHYGVSQPTISDIITGRTWSHLGEAA